MARATRTTDGYYVLKCRRCHATWKTVTDKARGHQWGAWTVVKQPGCENSGQKTQDSGETATISVGVEGGVKPCIYEWRRKRFEEEDKSAPLTASVSEAGIGLLRDWQNAAASWYRVHADTLGDSFNPGWRNFVIGTGGGSLLHCLTSSDLGHGRMDGPAYDAALGNCAYWVVVTDAAGNSVTSDEIRVLYGLRIAEQPQNVNWQEEVDDDLQAVFPECRAADGSGEYKYEWFRDNDFSVPYDIHDYMKVTERGTYVCRVTDLQLGTTKESVSKEAYDEILFRRCSFPHNATLWPRGRMGAGGGCGIRQDRPIRSGGTATGSPCPPPRARPTAKGAPPSMPPALPRADTPSTPRIPWARQTPGWQTATNGSSPSPGSPRTAHCRRTAAR